MIKFQAPKKAKATVRLTDVAKMVGVSTATVSRALANPQTVSPETRKTILEAVRKAGYTPNVAARNLRVRKTNMILVVVSQIGNIVFADVLSGIDEELNEHGYGLIIGHLDNKPEREEHFTRMAMAGTVDGILLLSLQRLPQGNGGSILDAHLPTVAINEKLDGALIPNVTVDNSDVSAQIAEHLFALGHRNFALLGGPANNYTSNERIGGFTARVKQLGGVLNPSNIWHGTYNFADGANIGPLFMQASPRPTAIFAANDEMAIGLITFLRQQGLNTPQDVSIVGFDGISYSQYLNPTLTTVLQPRREIGRAAAAVLLKQLQGEAVASDTVLKATLLQRESSGKVKV